MMLQRPGVSYLPWLWSDRVAKINKNALVLLTSLSFSISLTIIGLGYEGTKQFKLAKNVLGS